MPQTDFHNIRLTESQQAVMKQMLDFVADKHARVFILKGYAGTGKTTLMRFLINELQEHSRLYHLLASTGRASKVLQNLAGEGTTAQTIHAMVYDFGGLSEEIETEEDLKAVAAADGQLFLQFVATDVNPKTPEEKKIPQQPVVYIVDEASMVSDTEEMDITQAKFGNGRLLTDLLNYDQREGSKFIFVGDPCQLPPVEGNFSPALAPEYFLNTFGYAAQQAELTQIMRQDQTNGLIPASQYVRQLYNTAPANTAHYGQRRHWEYLVFKPYGNFVWYANEAAMVTEYINRLRTNGPNSTICVCRSNRKAYETSAAIRYRLGYPPQSIQPGELLMVIQNNMPTGLMNGDMVSVVKVSPKVEIRAMLAFREVRVKELFTGKEYTTLLMEDTMFMRDLNLGKVQQRELFADFIQRMLKLKIKPKKNKKTFYDKMREDPYLNALRCKFGYSVTCHKAQGGEWDDVFVFTPRNIMMNPTRESYQWVYTAMTRAKERLHLMNDFFYR